MAFNTYFPASNPTSGAANTKGAYIEVIASTPYDSSRLYLSTRNAVAANRFCLFDIATGAASSETVIISNIAVCYDDDLINGEFITFYVDIPAGTRVAIRCQAVTASSAFGVNIMLEDRALASISNPVTYAADTANSGGTQIDPGGTINTFGAYTQLTASTTADIDELIFTFTKAVQTTIYSAFVQWYIDIATGAASSEVAIVTFLSLSGNSVSDSLRPGIVSFPVSIPAGTRIAVRCRCSINTATTRLVCVTAIGMQT